MATATQTETLMEALWKLMAVVGSIIVDILHEYARQARKYPEVAARGRRQSRDNRGRIYRKDLRHSVSDPFRRYPAAIASHLHTAWS